MNVLKTKVAYTSKTAFNGTKSIVKWEQLPDGQVKKSTIKKNLSNRLAEEEIDKLTKRIPLDRRLELGDN